MPANCSAASRSPPAATTSALLCMVRSALSQSRLAFACMRPGVPLVLLAITHPLSAGTGARDELLSPAPGRPYHPVRQQPERKGISMSDQGWMELFQPIHVEWFEQTQTHVVRGTSADLGGQTVPIGFAMRGPAAAQFLQRLRDATRNVDADAIDPRPRGLQ